MTTTAPAQPQTDPDDDPSVFILLQEIAERTHSAAWDQYIEQLDLPIDKHDAVRNEVLEAIVTTLGQIRQLSGWPMELSLLLAGCKSSVEDLPHRTAPTLALQRVLQRLYKVHSTVALVSRSCVEDLQVSRANERLVGRLLGWAPQPEALPALALLQRDWAKADQLASSVVDNAKAIISHVANSERPCEAEAVAHWMCEARDVPVSAALDLIGILVAFDVLELSAGRSAGLLFITAP